MTQKDARYTTDGVHVWPWNDPARQRRRHSTALSWLRWSHHPVSVPTARCRRCTV